MLHGIPGTNDLERIYYELGRVGARAVGRKARWAYAPRDRETLLGLAADMSRYDPRLFEVLMDYCLRHWRDLHPARLRRVMQTMQTPQVFGVVGEFLRGVVDDPEVAPLFGYLLHGWRAVPLQLFFHHLYPPGSAGATEAAEAGVAEFRRWGFLATERPVNVPAAKTTIGSYDPSARRNILRRLLAERGRITVAAYRAAVHDAISRQQAYLDLTQYPGLRPSGRGRSAQWVLQ